MYVCMIFTRQILEKKNDTITHALIHTYTSSIPTPHEINREHDVLYCPSALLPASSRSSHIYLPCIHACTPHPPVSHSIWRGAAAAGPPPPPPPRPPRPCRHSPRTKHSSPSSSPGKTPWHTPSSRSSGPGVCWRFCGAYPSASRVPARAKKEERKGVKEDTINTSTGERVSVMLMYICDMCVSSCAGHYIASGKQYPSGGRKLGTDQCGNRDSCRREEEDTLTKRYP
jgi:hypothetical protein